MTMKLTTGILALAMMGGGFAATKAVAQNTDAIDNARSIAKSLQQKQANDTNAALDAAGVKQAAKPAPGAPAPAVKPATIPGSNPVPVAAPAPAPAKARVKSASAPAAAKKPAPVSASAEDNQLRHVNVVKGTDDIQIEISSSRAVTPRLSKLNSPARVVVELPETVVATAQNKIPVGSSGVKGVRIGMDGKTPPTTSVVVDLEKAVSYDLSTGPGDSLILTLHTGQSEAKSNPAPVKTAAPEAQKKVASAKPAVAAPKTPTTRVAAAKEPAAKPAAPAPKQQAKAIPSKPAPAPASASSMADTSKQPKPEDKKWAMSGKRDPFFSPVVQQNGSGCSTGKKCLEIGAINLRGVVKSDNGFIAVVTNNLNKAYFLRENDPVFNGYVMRITGDSVVFQETVQDKLGKPFTREVVKRIFTPAV